MRFIKLLKGLFIGLWSFMLRSLLEHTPEWYEARRMIQRPGLFGRVGGSE